MAQDKEHKIRERAHALWLEEGSPTGRHEEHWERATREIEEAGAPAKTKAAKPKVEKTPRAKVAKPASGEAMASKATPAKSTRSKSAVAKPDAPEQAPSNAANGVETAPSKKRGRPAKSAAEQKPSSSADNSLKIKTAI